MALDTLSYKTKSVNAESADKKWLVVDAKDQTLGRLASKVAFVLRGKHKATFTPHADTGDNVIILNADQIKLSGNKEETKEYIRHTGYPGGQRVAMAKDLMKDSRSTRVVEAAVKGMLPKTKLGRAVHKNLYVYAGAEHPHAGQQPVELDLNTIK